jgi:hypothetical protein
MTEGALQAVPVIPPSEKAGEADCSLGISFVEQSAA